MVVGKLAEHGKKKNPILIDGVMLVENVTNILK